MSRYTPKVIYKTEFDGDKITVKFNQLNREAFFKLAPLASRVEENSTDANQAGELLDAAAEVIPEESVSINGLTDADGNELGWDTVISQTYFIGLAAELIAHMIGASFLGKKNGST